jgi:hypothetical protein
MSIKKLWFAYRSHDTGNIGTILVYRPDSETNEAAWIRAMRKRIGSQPAKDATYLGWAFGKDIYPLASLTKTNLARMEALMPKGIPRYVRCYKRIADNVADPYTVVYTGRCGNGEFVAMNANPFHPTHGFAQHGRCHDGTPLDRDGYKWPVAVGRKDENLGLHIAFIDLPEDCRKVVLRDYRAAWDLPLPLSEALLARDQEVKPEDGKRLPLPELPTKDWADTTQATPIAEMREVIEMAQKTGIEMSAMCQVIEHHGDSARYRILNPILASDLEKAGLISHCESCLEGQYHANLQPTFTWKEFIVEVYAHSRAATNQLSAEYEQLGKGLDLEDVDDEDGLGIIPISPVADYGTHDAAEELALALARERVESEYMARNWKRMLPLYHRFYWNEDGYCLGLFDGGDSDANNKPVSIGYVLIGPHRDKLGGLDVIFSGNDFNPSPLYDSAIGPQAATACLHLLLSITDRPNDSVTDRQMNFYAEEAEFIDTEWPVEQEKLEAPLGRDQYGEPVPADLVMLPMPQQWLDFDEDFRSAALKVNWYEATGPDEFKWLNVSAAAMGKHADNLEGQEEWPCASHEVRFRRVDDVLKRWNIEDGFYHA